MKDISLDANEIDRINNWVESTKEINVKDNFSRVVKDNPLIKKHSIKYLKDNNLVDKDNNVTLYRYLNIAESNKLRPDKGLTSTTLDPFHAKKMAIQQSEVTGSVLKPGQTASFFDSLDPFTAAGKYETKTLVRQPVVLEYKIPVEKVDAYMPAVYDNLDNFSMRSWNRSHAENTYSNLIDDLVNDGYDYGSALDEVADSYSVTSDFDNFVYTALDESEIVADLTNIKPTNMFVDKKAIDKIGESIAKTTKKFARGGPSVMPPNSIAEPISPTEMRTAFGGPLYQMLNPGTRQIVDNLGLRGQGIGGLAAMVFGPGKAKAPATIIKRLDKLIKKYKRQQNNYERELRNIPYDGPPAERAAQKEFQRLMKTHTEIQMVLDRNRGFGLLKYTNDALFSQPKVPSRMFMTAPNMYKPKAETTKKIDKLIQQGNEKYAKNRQLAKIGDITGAVAAGEQGSKIFQKLGFLLDNDPKNVLYGANKYPELIENGKFLGKIIPTVPKQPFDLNTKLSILNKYDANAFTTAGKKEFLDTLKPKSLFKKDTQYINMNPVPKRTKDNPYFIYYPDTYASYRIGDKFDNVEQAIIRNIRGQNVVDPGMRLQVRKGDPKNIEKTELLHEIITGM